MLEVIDPGLLTAIQDAGRPNLAHLGVPPSGACDPWSLAVANLLLGNSPAAPILEVTLGGLVLEALETCAIGLAGADLGAMAGDGSGPRLSPGRVHRLRAGERLRFAGGSRGAREYLSLAGGIESPLVLGSASPLPWGFGAGSVGAPFAGRAPGLAPGTRLTPVRRGDLAMVGRAWPSEGAASGPPILGSSAPAVVDVVAGPDPDRFGPGALEQLEAPTWTVAGESDRMGLRLVGPPLPVGSLSDLVSVPMVWGAIQVPADGAPIVLLADHQTVGGYPVIAVAASADRPTLGQLRPGDVLRFRQTTIYAAQARWRASLESLRLGAQAMGRDAIWEDLSLEARG
jgi:biotin-dependent carboxylase-like uncharacterized protein